MLTFVSFVFQPCFVFVLLPCKDQLPTNLTVYWPAADINGSIISLNPFDNKNYVSKKYYQISEFQGKFIGILPFLVEKVEEAISLKDFDDLYQRTRESTNMTKTTPKVTTNVYQISKNCEDQALQMNSVLSHLSLGKSILFQPAALYLTNIVFI